MAYETPRILSDQPLEPQRGDDRRAHFHFDEYAITLARLIAARSTRTPLTIGVYGPWGSGKTTLMRRVMALLQGHKVPGRDGKPIQWKTPDEAQDFRPVRTVWFNAWKYHEEDSLLAALIRTILQEMARGGVFEKIRADWEQRDIKLFSLFISAFRLKFGLPGVAEAEIYLDPKAHEKLPEFKQHLAFFDAFEETLERLIRTWAGEDGVLAVFIDDLDRCPPDRVVQVLEAIKLFLDKTGAVFVLAADEEPMLQAVMHHYREVALPEGEASPARLRQWARDYMMKFVQLRFILPPMREDKLREEYLPDLAVQIQLEGPWAVPEALQQVLVTSADANLRKVKISLNNLNLAWAMLRNSGQLPAGTNLEELWPKFVGLHAVLWAAPRAFVERLRTLSRWPALWQRFWAEALAWAQGEEVPEETARELAPFQTVSGFRRALVAWGEMELGTPEAQELETLLFFAPPPEAEMKAVGSTAGTAPGTPRDVLVVDSEGLGLALVHIPKGLFLMGSLKDDEVAYDDEKSQHEQDIPYDYWIGRFPVTWRQYSMFDAKWAVPAGKDDHPVVTVSWYDALKFVDWLNKQHGDALQETLRARGVPRSADYRFMLPSEREWEKAARGPYGNIWPWGNEWRDGLCNSREEDIGDTTPVGAYSPQGDSPYGVADMAGNVWEWTRSIYRKYPYDPADGRENLQMNASRVLRGGSWFENRWSVRAAFREWDSPSVADDDFGFRVVVVPISVISGH